MREIYLRLGIERGWFGRAKPFLEQKFVERLYEHMPDEKEYGNNESSVKDAFGTAVNMLYKEWNHISNLPPKRLVHVLINFNKDYSAWRVIVTTLDKDFQMKHEDYDSSIKQEESQILEKYGFVAEKAPETKYEVKFRGNKTVMGEEQYKNFIKDVGRIYPQTCHAEYTSNILERP